MSGRQLLSLFRGSYKLQVLHERDFPSLLELEMHAFPIDYWSERAFRRELRKNPESIKVIKNNDKVIGYVHTEFRDKVLPTGKKIRVGEIGSVAVHADHRGKKLGEKLFKHGVKQLKKKQTSKIMIRTRLDNHAMRKLAETKFGFKTTGIRKNAYDDGASAYVMILS